MTLRNPPKHFVPEWLPRMKERSAKAATIRLNEMRRRMEFEMLQARAKAYRESRDALRDGVFFNA